MSLASVLRMHVRWNVFATRVSIPSYPLYVTSNFKLDVTRSNFGESRLPIVTLWMFVMRSRMSKIGLQEFLIHPEVRG